MLKYQDITCRRTRLNIVYFEILSSSVQNTWIVHLSTSFDNFLNLLKLSDENYFIHLQLSEFIIIEKVNLFNLNFLTDEKL